MRRSMGLTLMLAAGAAAAADRIAVVSVGQCTSPGSAITARSFRSALIQRSVTPVLNDAETAAPFGGLADRTIPELNGAIASARSDFYSDKTEPAQVTLNKALVDVGRLPPSDARWSLERDMLTFLTQMQLKTDKAAAEATMTRILRVDPDYKPDTSTYPPSFQRFTSDVRKALKRKPTNRMDVTVSPTGKPVYVGGRRVGTAPISLKFPVGEYRVEVDWGYRGLAKTVTVSAPPATVKPVEFSASIEGVVVPDGGPCLEPIPDQSAALATALPLLNASKIIGVRTDISGTNAYLAATELSNGGADQRTVRVRLPAGTPQSESYAQLASYFATGKGGPLIEVIPGAAGAGAAAAVVVAPVPTVAAPITPAAGAPTAIPPLPPEAAPAAAVTKSAEDPGAGLRTAGWVLTGVGIAGVAVGVIEFLGANSSKNDLSSQQVNGAFPAGSQASFASSNDSIKSKQTIAVIAGGIGVACLATGVALLFVAGGKSAGAGVSISPTFVPGGGGAMVAGSF